MDGKIRVAVRMIYHKAVKPSADIIEFDHETWMEFLHGDVETRKKIVCRMTWNEEYTYKVRDVAWFPLEDQDICNINIYRMH